VLPATEVTNDGKTSEKKKKASQTRFDPKRERGGRGPLTLLLIGGKIEGRGETHPNAPQISRRNVVDLRRMSSWPVTFFNREMSRPLFGRGNLPYGCGTGEREDQSGDSGGKHAASRCVSRENPF